LLSFFVVLLSRRPCKHAIGSRTVSSGCLVYTSCCLHVQHFSWNLFIAVQTSVLHAHSVQDSAYSRFWEVQRSANYCLLYRHWMNEEVLFAAVLCVYVQLREPEDGEGIAATAQAGLLWLPAPLPYWHLCAKAAQAVPLQVPCCFTPVTPQGLWHWSPC